MKSRVSDWMRNEWKKAVLSRVDCKGSISAFRMRQPGMGRMQSCLIIFCEEGIVICGDYCPEQNGVISNLGYGLEWFSTPKGEEYLCEKFLRTEFSPKACREAVVDRVKDIEESLRDHGSERLEKTLGVYKEALQEDDGESVEQMYFGTEDRFYNLVGKANDWDSMLGDGARHDYNPRSAEVLCAIQQRFVEEYARLVAEEAS